MTELKKPTSIEANTFMSDKWDEITKGREFQASDIPTIMLLCQWYAVVDRCMEDMNVDGDVQVAYQNDIGDLKALPQLNTMKQASAEIRALNKQLGINDEVKAERPREVTVIHGLFQNRQSKAKNSSNTKAG